MNLPTRYLLRNVLATRGTALLVVASIAAAVAVVVTVRGMNHGLKGAILATGLQENVIVTRRGSMVQNFSIVTTDQAKRIAAMDHVARGPAGEVLVSEEIVDQIFFARPDGVRENLPVRGLPPIAFQVHDEVRLAEGRMWNPGVDEVLIGRNVVGRYPGFHLGGQIGFGRRGPWTVVGILDGGGSSFDSEVWADLDVLLDDTRFPYRSIVALKSTGGEGQAALLREIERDPKLRAVPEPVHYAEMTSVAGQIAGIGAAVATLLGIGIVFGVRHVASIDLAERADDIRVLRAVGFGPVVVMRSVLMRALALTLLGALLGLVVASVAAGHTLSFASFLTYSTLLYQIDLTPAILLEGLLLALFCGAIGAFGPARRALRAQVTTGHRPDLTASASQGRLARVGA